MQSWQLENSLFHHLTISIAQTRDVLIKQPCYNQQRANDSEIRQHNLKVNKKLSLPRCGLVPCDQPSFSKQTTHSNHEKTKV